MAYLTDRKRVRGLGAAGNGTDHHWSMTVSAVGLLILVPTFIFILAPLLGAPYEVVHARLAHPFPAIVTGLTIVVGFMHFKTGVRMLIDDYVQGAMRETLTIVTTVFSYGAAATGIFALARIAF